LVLPLEVLRLPEELARVDALLDDPAFFAPVSAALRPADRPAVDTGAERVGYPVSIASGTIAGGWMGPRP
jgi:hypothetical protein